MKESDLEILRESLPQQPNIFIQGRERFINSAVLAPLILINGEYNLLFEKRSPNIRQEGEICFPGGLFDPERDKDFEAAAIRETVEELGIKANDLTLLGRLDSMPTPFGAFVEPFVGILDIDSLTELKQNTQEVAEVFCLPVAYFVDNPPQEYFVKMEVQPYHYEDNEKVYTFPAQALGLPKLYWDNWKVMDSSIFVYPTKPWPIWGLTADIVRQIVERLVRGRMRLEEE